MGEYHWFGSLLHSLCNGIKWLMPSGQWRKKLTTQKKTQQQIPAPAKKTWRFSCPLACREASSKEGLWHVGAGTYILITLVILFLINLVRFSLFGMSTSEHWLYMQTQNQAHQKNERGGRGEKFREFLQHWNYQHFRFPNPWSVKLFSQHGRIHLFKHDLIGI